MKKKLYCCEELGFDTALDIESLAEEIIDVYSGNKNGLVINEMEKSKEDYWCHLDGGSVIKDLCNKRNCSCFRGGRICENRGICYDSTGKDYILDIDLSSKEKIKYKITDKK